MVGRMNQSMKMKSLSLLVALLCFFSITQAQSAAALAKLNQRFNLEQLAEMQQNTHYKYEGLLLFYSSSYLVIDNGQTRPATELEIAALDIDQYNALRSEKSAVSVHDATTGLDLQLLSRADFEKVVLAHLSEGDASAYLAYKAAALSTQGKTNE